MSLAPDEHTHTPTGPDVSPFVSSVAPLLPKQPENGSEKHISLLPKIPVEPDHAPSAPPMPTLLVDKEARDEEKNATWPGDFKPELPHKPGTFRDRRRENGGIRKQRGKAFNPMQYSVLYHCHKAQAYPSREAIAAIATYANLDTAKVKVWFQNARQRGIPDVALMPLPVDPLDIMAGKVTSELPIQPYHEGPHEILPPPFIPPLEKLDVGVQCSLIPSRFLEMLERGELDHLDR
ncbi:Homeobox domain [Carpediemonas membranifera]|uniref:Homeobox domain n=1 Tax=Carpediemonas membranifera TaxID=201153 RepID=A0A8J6BWK7_9EUKA|nr:Homeobox domain [Carpediemonas membranifera]|eukprot:KAG9392541.1 Homeobox domain [Carpediemonas membranifera]